MFLTKTNKKGLVKSKKYGAYEIAIYKDPNKNYFATRNIKLNKISGNIYGSEKLTSTVEIL
jgi:hypothetical protein